MSHLVLFISHGSLTFADSIQRLNFWLRYSFQWRFGWLINTDILELSRIRQILHRWIQFCILWALFIQSFLNFLILRVILRNRFLKWLQFWWVIQNRAKLIVYRREIWGGVIEIFFEIGFKVVSESNRRKPWHRVVVLSVLWKMFGQILKRLGKFWVVTFCLLHDPHGFADFYHFFLEALTRLRLKAAYGV